MSGPEDGPDRRSGEGERRRYVRRAVQVQSPPYFEAFERIAQALERVADQLENRSVVLPDVAPRDPASSARR